jgi:hypothetical protein
VPYIIMKRSDVPAGVLQVLDMDPNTSLRNLTLDVPGQTKYVDPVQNDTVRLLGAGPITVRTDTNGLGGWLATNVNDGTGAAAFGLFSVLTTPLTIGPPLVTVGGVPFTATPGPRVPGTPTFDGTLPIPGIAIDLAIAINDPVVQATMTPPGSVTAVAGVPGPPDVTVTANVVGTVGNTIDFTTLLAPEILAVPPGGFLGGGADADSLTAAEINGSSAAILALYGFGDLTSAAGTLTLGDINGAMVTGAITAAQLDEVLDILAGRSYFVPAGTQIDSDGTTYDVQPPVGTTGGPWFPPNTLRPLFNNDGLPLSFAQGELLGFTDSGFVYGGVAGDPNGEAVVVYNNDGTFYTP